MSESLATAERDKKMPGTESAGAGQQEADSERDPRLQAGAGHVRLPGSVPAGGETTQPLVATVSFYRGKVKAFETEPLQVTEGLNAKSKALPIRFSVPLE